ncbi:MAG: hypothetical protein WC948_03745 [Thermovirgaceae bacterium]
MLEGDMTPFEVEREGIRGIDRERVEKAAQSGRRLKLICRAWHDDKGVHGSVGVEGVMINHHSHWSVGRSRTQDPHGPDGAHTGDPGGP